MTYERLRDRLRELNRFWAFAHSLGDRWLEKRISEHVHETERAIGDAIRRGEDERA